MAPVVTPVRTSTPRGTACFKCGKVGHYVNACPKRNAPNTPIQSQHSQQMRNESQIPKGNKGKQSYARGRVNHVSAETAQENPWVVFGMCLVNSALASVLFDHYKKSFDPWRNSHDVFWFRHRSQCIDDKQSDFVTDSQCWIWSPMWSPNTMTLCQFRNRFRHRLHCIHDNSQISS
jgi:hypothetical protein